MKREEEKRDGQSGLDMWQGEKEGADCLLEEEQAVDVTDEGKNFFPSFCLRMRDGGSRN